jgi:autophagy-related protein 9
LAHSQADIQTMPWPEVVRLIGDIKKHNPGTSLSNRDALAEFTNEGASNVKIAKLDAHDIAK